MRCNRKKHTFKLCNNPTNFEAMEITETINNAGYKISALDVENALMRHPAVREAAVVGVPDEMLGQKVQALPPLFPTLNQLYASYVIIHPSCR